jgi:hypothetical protein
VKATTKQRLGEALTQADAWNLKGDALIGHLMTYARVSEQTALRFYRNKPAALHGNKHKQARAYAKQEAERRGLLKKGEADLYGKWWRRLFSRLFPKMHAKYSAMIKRWYKRTLKDWSRNAYAYIHDRDAQAVQRARVKMEKQQRRKRIKEALRKAEEAST